jgi:hypothetical protein
MFRVARVFIFMSLLMLICSCSSLKTMESYKHTGFLSDYKKLKPSKIDPEAEIWTKPGFSLKNYNKIILDRILIWYRGDIDYKGIDPDKLKILTDYFHNAITKNLGDAYPLTDNPGPDVLRIRVAITELVPTKPMISVIVLVTPYVTIADILSSTASKGGIGSSPYVGDAAIECEFLDSITNEQLLAFVDRKIGKKYNVDLKEGPVNAVETAAESYAYSYTTWKYTKEAFDFWAQALRKRLDEAHGVQTGNIK